MDDRLKEAVRRRYAEAAKAVTAAKPACCCGCGERGAISADIYGPDELVSASGEALLASLGCGNPVALAEIAEGEVVLDLGSGGGLDVLLSAGRTGPRGKVYGLDMTDEMLELARRNAENAGVGNVEFLKGEMENIPLPDSSVDVIISNCVINLSGDKDRVFAEAFRVLKPGGRLAVADIVLRRELSEELREDVALWTGCVAGALLETEYLKRLEKAGFRDVKLRVLRTYTAEDVAGLILREMETAAARLADLAEAVCSALVEGRRPN